MPELPEVDAITGVVAKHAVGSSIIRIRVLRGPHYFEEQQATHTRGVERLPYDTDVPQPGSCVLGGMRLGIDAVFRLGKYVVMKTRIDNQYLVAHNAMTGYFDWAHEPWTFDYVEGDRKSTDSDVRVMLDFERRPMVMDDPLVLRFHDARLFGRMQWSTGLPRTGPELMETPHMMPGARIITLREFAEWILADRRTVKEALMDQFMLAGIGNIYASEGCHLAGVDPHVRGVDLNPRQVPVLLEALRAVVEMRIPDINYDNLAVYRQERCGSCGGPVKRTEIAKRATFSCMKCQGEPG